MAVLVAPLGGPTEGGLEREAVYQIKLTPHNHSRSGLARLLDHEVAPIEIEVVCVSGKQKGKNPFLEPVRLLVCTPVHEEVLCARVSMVVTVEKNVA